MLLKRATTGRLALHSAVKKVADEVMSASVPTEPSGPFGAELAALGQAKKAFLLTAGAALQRFGESIKDEQEVLMNLSDIVMQVFAMDTAILRLMKKSSEPQQDVVRTFVNDAMSRVEFSAKQILAAVSEGDNLRTHLAALRRLLRWIPINTVKGRQRIADYLIDNGRYAL